MTKAVWCLLLVMGGLSAQTVEDLDRELDAYRRVLMDWGGLTFYGSDNVELKWRPEVVFLGDEVTENWGKGSAFFPGKRYLNRGITRQTAAQMLVRFRQDVIALKPRVVIIAAGLNDIGSVMGPETEPTIGDFVASMAELAKVHGIRVVLASVTPVCDCFGNQTARRPVRRIVGFNNWLKDYAKQSGLVFLDYYSALVDGRAFKKDLTADGLVPNEAGYAVMAPLAERAIAEALGKNSP